MGNWNDDLLKEIEAIASEAEKHSDETRPETEDGMADAPQDSKDIVYSSTVNGVAVCRMLFNSLRVPEDFLLESVNPAFCTIFGVSSERVVGKKGNKFFAGRKKLPALDLLYRVLREKETVSFLFFAEKFGRLFDILAFSLGSNKFCMVFSDAAARVAAERERREQERFTEKIFGSVETWITLLDDRGRTVFWNAAAERLSGISAEEALSGGFDFRDIFCPGEHHRENFAQKMDACRRGEIPEFRMDTCVNSRDGSPRCVEWTIRRWDFEDVGDTGFLLLGRDVTEARRMEEDFRESESRYAAAFRESQAAMFIVDPDSGTVCDCNDAALDFYGYTREEMTGLKNTEFNTAPPQELFRKMQDAKAGRMNRFLSSHRLKNGEIRNVEVYSSPMLYNGTTYLYSIIHDITEKQRLEEELESLSFDCTLQAKILRSILENSSDYLYVFDREGNFRFVGKKGADLFKRTPEEMAGLSWKHFGIPEERVAPLNEHLKQVFSTGKIKNGMIVLPAPRGDTPLEYSLNPTFGEDGGVGTVFCSMRAVP